MDIERKPGSGRKPGYKHSVATKQKISEAMSGRTKTKEHRSHISASMFDLDGKCSSRLKSLRKEYPGQENFFDDNEEELLFAMQDIRSEKELDDIKRFLETKTLGQLRQGDRVYQYSSSSCYAAEDAMIALLDFKRLLQKYH